MPYQRDAGLTEKAAGELAAAANGIPGLTAHVEREGRFFVVRVNTHDETITLRDAEDWRWLQSKRTTS